jgi:hypothetical protein
VGEDEVNVAIAGKGKTGKTGTHLDLRSTDPPNGRKFVLHQQVVRFVVETPLADDEVCTGVLDPTRGGGT